MAADGFVTGVAPASRCLLLFLGATVILLAGVASVPHIHKRGAVSAVVVAGVFSLGNGTAEVVAERLPSVPLGRLCVLFGRQRAKILRLNPSNNSVVCEVPPSPFAGIGWSTVVTVKLLVLKGHAAITKEAINKASRSICRTFTNIWTYEPTTPPTRVSNLGVLWITERTGVALKVLRLFERRLGPDWRFQVFVAEDLSTYYFSSPYIRDLVDEGRLELVSWPRITREQYARLCVDPSFWEEEVNGDRVLMFQTDSVPCSGSLHDISEFYDYDFVGAAWPDAEYGGNGGLSLRNRTALIQLLKAHSSEIMNWTKSSKWTAEDVLICLFPAQKHFTNAVHDVSGDDAALLV